MKENVLRIEDGIDHLVFNHGVRVSQQREAGFLRDGRSLVLEEDKNGNVVGISLN